MYLDIKLGFDKLAKGGYSPTFMISEHSGRNSRYVPFTCPKVAQSEQEALRIAKAYAVKHIKNNYPAETKVRFKPRN